MRTLCLLMATALAGPVLADGGFIPPLTGRPAGEGVVSSAAQKAVIIRDGKHEILLLQTTYSGPAAGFAWIVPVPSRPVPKDIFVASEDFIAASLETSQPDMRSRLTDPWDFWMLGLVMFGGMGPKRPDDDASRVTVWDRLRVGNYEAAVLSAADGKALVGWLTANGYAVPAELAPVAAEYTRKRWYFIALKMNAAKVSAQAVLRDVEPLGLRFRTEQLVYPLRISSVSAPARTALILVVYDNDAVQPRELPVVTLPRETRLPRRSSYHALVRQVLGRHAGAALLVERRTEPSPAAHRPDKGLQDLLDGVYRKDRSPTVAGWPTQTVTRFYGLLPREAMADLTFDRARAGILRVHIERTGQVGHGWFGAALLYGIPQLAFVGLIAMWQYRRRLRHPPPPPANPDEPVRERAILVCVVIGALAVLAAVGSLVGSLDETLWPLLILPGFAIIFWPVTLVMAARAVATLVVARSRYRSFWVFWTTIAVIFVYCLQPVTAAFVSTHGSGAEPLLDQRLQMLDSALNDFADTYGCYPEQLRDLTRPRPTRGLDASGNPVAPMSGPGRAILKRLPVDPLTGRRNTWVYDVLSPGMVDSGGYAVTVTCE